MHYPRKSPNYGNIRSNPRPSGCYPPNFGADASGAGPAKPLFYREAYYMASTISIASSGAAETVGNATNASIRVSSDADFEIMKINFVATDPRIIVKFRSGNGEYITPEGIDLQAIGGTPFNNAGPGAKTSWFTPYILSQPWLLPRLSQFIIEAQDYSGSANTLYLCFWGAQAFCGAAPWDNPKYTRGQPIIRSTGKTAVGASNSQVLTINTDTGYDTLVHKISAVRTGSALCDITQSMENGNEAWGNGSTHIDNLFGSGQFAHKFSAGRLVKAGATLSFNVTDLSGSTNYTEIVMEGTRYYG